MKTTEKINFVEYFLSSSDSNISSRFSKSAQFIFAQNENIESLNVYLVALLIVFLVIRTVLHKRKLNLCSTSYTDTLPQVQWIPFVKLPFVDTIIFLYKLQKDGIKLTEILRKKYGPNFKLKFGHKTFLVVSDPNTIQKLLSSTNRGHLEKSEFVYSLLLTRLLNDGLVASKVNTWSHHRSVVSSAFKYTSFTTYFKVINEEAKKLVQSAYNASSKVNGREILDNLIMKEIIDHCILIVTLYILMGSETYNFSGEHMTLLFHSMKRFKQITMERCHRPALLIPIIWWMHPMKKELDDSIEKITYILNQISGNYREKLIEKEKKLEKQANFRKASSQNHPNIINDRQGDVNSEFKPFQCVVELMIKSGLGNKEIADETATFLAAGHETLQVAIDLLIFHLARNPEHQKICQMEIDNLFYSKGNRQKGSEDMELNMEDFSGLKYLKLCILESLRLTPAIPAFIRSLQKPLKLDNGNVIPVGDLGVVIWPLHRDPEIYPNPEIFDPTRFLPENVKNRHPYSFLPFSMGMRNCIGWKIALLEINVIMTRILRHFELYTTDGPNDVKLLFDITLKLERPYNITFTRRVLKHTDEKY